MRRAAITAANTPSTAMLLAHVWAGLKMINFVTAHYNEVVIQLASSFIFL